MDDHFLGLSLSNSNNKPQQLPSANDPKTETSIAMLLQCPKIIFQEQQNPNKKNQITILGGNGTETGRVNTGQHGNEI